MGRVLSHVHGPMCSSSCASTVSSVLPPQSILSHPLPVHGIPPCPLLSFICPCCLSETEVSFRDLKYQGCCSLHPCWCWEWELGTHEIPRQGRSTSPTLLETPCLGFMWALTLLLLSKAASTIKGCSVVHSGVATTPTPLWRYGWCHHSYSFLLPCFLLRLRVQGLLFLWGPTTNFLFSVSQLCLSVP